MSALSRADCQSSMDKCLAFTCEQLSSNNWSVNRPLYVDLSSNDGWCNCSDECRRQGFVSVLESLSKNSTVRAFKIKNAILTPKLRDSFEKMLRRNRTLSCIWIESVMDSERKCLTLPNSLSQCEKSTLASNIQEVSIRRCTIDIEGCGLLGRAMSTCPHLKSLELSDVIFEGGISALSASVRDPHNALQRFSLSNIRFTTQGLSQILDCLSKNQSISHLSLENLNLGDDIAMEIYAILRQNQHLSTLNLPANNLSSDAVSWVGKGLSMNTTLQSLSLAYNPVGDEGAQALVDALTDQNNTTLKELDLDHCEIWTSGCLAIATGLRRMNGGLRRLGLAGNDLESYDCAIQLLGSVMQNTTIESISGLEVIIYQEAQNNKNGNWSKVGRFLMLNRNNRRQLLASPASLPLWPRVLAKTGNDADFLFHLISSMPSIIGGGQ